jgi:hypothetical protein
LTRAAIRFRHLDAGESHRTGLLKRRARPALPGFGTLLDDSSRKIASNTDQLPTARRQQHVSLIRQIHVSHPFPFEFKLL